ncbi:MAG TPA: hypothetical protein VGO45_13370 [Bacteroidia bacterium]|nr:hypothetical protein [Bacteroidia bacterium]
MNSIILGAMGIPAFIAVVLMISYYDSIREQLQNGFNRGRDRFRSFIRNEQDTDSASVSSYRKGQEDDFRDWDLSGGTFGI